MRYSIKNLFVSLYKRIQIAYRLYLDQRNIARAYKDSGGKPALTITRPFIIWAVAVLVCIGVVSTGLLYSDRILRGVSFVGEWVKNTAPPKKPDIARPELKKESVMVVDTVPEKPAVQDTATEIKAPPAQETYHNILELPDEMNYLILANKANRTMSVLFRKDDVWSLFRTYFMAIGENGGIKLMKGDKRTPEGSYFIVGRKEKSELHQMYGPLAFVLNYPNDDDRKNGRTGNGIWIHGTNPDSTPLMTRGCLELENANILEMGGFLKSGIGTPVVIINNEAVQDPVAYPDYAKIESERRRILSQYRKQRDYFISLLQKWKHSWESKNIDDYSLFYHTDTFYGQGLGWDAWREKKIWTFQTYTEIEISLDKIFLADYSDTTVVLKFIQGYRSDQLQALNGKKLELVKSGEQWKIYLEHTFPKEELLL